MQVFDNFIPRQYQLELHNTILDTSFPWRYQDFTINNKNVPLCINTHEYRDTPYFHHVLYKNDYTLKSEYIELVRPLLLFFEYRTGYKIKNIVRIVTNLLLPTEKPIRGIPHIDANFTNKFKLKTLLYYINDSDGDTCLFKEVFKDKEVYEVSIQDKVTPTMGKAIVFDSNQFHCSTTPIKNRRLVINAILEIE